MTSPSDAEIQIKHLEREVAKWKLLYDQVYRELDRLKEEYDIQDFEDEVCQAEYFAEETRWLNKQRMP